MLLPKKGGDVAESIKQMKERGQKVDVVERFQLKEMPKMEKPDWGTYIKDYVKRVKISMEMEKTSKEKVEQFKEGATALAHHIMRNYD